MSASLGILCEASTDGHGAMDAAPFAGRLLPRTPRNDNGRKAGYGVSELCAVAHRRGVPPKCRHARQVGASPAAFCQRRNEGLKVETIAIVERRRACVGIESLAHWMSHNFQD